MAHPNRSTDEWERSLRRYSDDEAGVSENVLRAREAVSQRLEASIVAEEARGCVQLSQVVHGVAQLKEAMEVLTTFVFDELEATATHFRSHAAQLRDMSYKVALLMAAKEQPPQLPPTPPPPSPSQPPPHRDPLLLSQKAVKSSAHLKGVIAEMINHSDAASQRLAQIEAAVRSRDEATERRLDETTRMLAELQGTVSAVHEMREEVQQQSQTLLTHRLQSIMGKQAMEGASPDAGAAGVSRSDRLAVATLEHNLAKLEERVSVIQAACGGMAVDLHGVKAAQAATDHRTSTLRASNDATSAAATEALRYSRDTRKATKRCFGTLSDALGVVCPPLTL